MCKADLEDAYKAIVVRPSDWHYLGSSWINDDKETEYYLDHVLPFGLKSSANIFTLFADGLQFCMEHEGISNCCHYMDDYFTAGPPDSDECKINLNIMLSTCEKSGVKVNPKKIVGPSTCIEFLGIIIDSKKMELRMSEERLADILEELFKWKNRKRGTKRELLSLLGKLIFVCRIIQPGRIFLCRLFQLASSLKFLHHRTRLNIEARHDVDWWISFLESWNKKSLFYEDVWSLGPDMHLQTDASYSLFGCSFGNLWFNGEFKESDLSKSITWKELYAVVIACATWREHLKQKKVLILCDNEAVVYCVNNGKSKCPFVMELIRILFFVCSSSYFDCRMRHVPGNTNTIADALSRNHMNTFRRLCPQANYRPSCPASLQPWSQYTDCVRADITV